MNYTPVIRHLLLAAALLIGIPAPSFAFPGKVVKVTDGDTITVLIEDKKQVKVRLANIDAPESGQPFGQTSKKALLDLVAGKTVEVEEKGRDRYKRIIGVVRVGGEWVNGIMVMGGFAWVYRRYNDDPNLLVMEADARVNGRGLWADPKPVPPWEWRRSH